MQKTLLAHSAEPIRNIPQQTYYDHSKNVTDIAVKTIEEAFSFSKPLARYFVAVLKIAGEYHDLGKIDEKNQAVLRGDVEADRLPVDHWLAGAKYLIELFKQAKMPQKNMLRLAALLSMHHHAKGPMIDIKIDLMLEDVKIENMQECLEQHEKLFGKIKILDHEDGLKKTSLFIRFMLSFLAEGDCQDTANHYGYLMPKISNKLLPSKRRKKLDAYVKSLQNKTTRSKLRTKLYDACKKAAKLAQENEIVYCDAPVGQGKTTALMVYALEIARIYKKRKIFVVQPYTTIIDQTAKTLVNALVLEGEEPSDIIMPNHCRMEFSEKGKEWRIKYSKQWLAPIVSTTDVQFFETLASNCSAKLRKLHSIANSVIIFDEFDLAMCLYLFPLAFRWLKELVDVYNCHIVIASGTMTPFWDIPVFANFGITKPRNINEGVSKELREFENKRVLYGILNNTKSPNGKYDIDSICKHIMDKASSQGPCLCVFNTLAAAGLAAKYIFDNYGSDKVYHFSNALTPTDNKITLEKIKLRLQNKEDKNWVLVATSGIECGVDVDFNVGFRQMSTVRSLFQFGGRINREGKLQIGEVWSFDLNCDEIIKQHPAFMDTKHLVKELFFNGKAVRSDEQTLRNSYIKETSFTSTHIDRAKECVDADKAWLFEKVASSFRIITDNKHTVIIDPVIINKIKNGEKCRSQDITNNSVSLFDTKVETLGCPPIDKNIYEWHMEYDNFLGIMKGILKLAKKKS